MQSLDADLSRLIASVHQSATALVVRSLHRLAVELPHWFTDVNHRFYWAYLAAFAVLGGWAWRCHYRRSPRQGLRAMLAFLFPPAIYRHPSALIDYQLVLANRMLGPASVLADLMFRGATIASVAHATQLAVAHLLGTPLTPAHWSFASALGFALGMTVARDFVTFFTHLLHHRIPLLWEFHKVHHSAQVLTPVTVFRKHPVYNVIEYGMNILLIGPLQGMVALCFVGQAAPITLFGANIVFALFHLAGANLRHSHIWWSFGPRLSHVLSSPAQHQIHHSKAAQHANKNFGEVFSLWDWLFGTLYVPGREPEVLEFGLAEEEGAEHRSLWGIYTQPLLNCVSLLRPARRPVSSAVSLSVPARRK